MCQFYNGGIAVNGGCVNFKLAKMLRIKLALTGFGVQKLLSCYMKNRN